MLEKTGKVYLIGAGPGDPGLLTLKGKEVLSIAEVVIYDYLANPELLKYCQERVEKIYVGKKGGEPSFSQEKINELLVKKAKEGKIVARLKGGDPFLFGRGGEEVEELEKHGIPFEIVPGVTSAIAVPAYAGIPVTHRNYTSTLAIVTGHEAQSKEKTQIDFKALSRIGTLIFLMGVKNLPNLVENLLKEGKSPNTPCAIIQWGTTPCQKTLTGTLSDILEKVKTSSIGSPAIIVVGEVVNLREKFNWFEKKPLFGKKILITRTREQASKLKKSLEDLGALVYEVPTIKIVPLLNEEVFQTLKELHRYHWIVFTSENGVRVFYEIILRTGLDLRIFGPLKIAVIGKATKEALEVLGIKPDLIPEKEYTQEGLALAFKGIDLKNQRVLLVRAKEAREVLPKALGERGAEVKILSVYETVLPEDSKMKLNQVLEEDLDLITFTSSSTVKNFFTLLESKEKLKEVKFASIGPITSQTLRSYGFEPHLEAKEYTIEGLVLAIKEFFKEGGVKC
ncbi:MAG: uroporphyrinogen-III C-methyltransferase [Thermodesulfobacteriaceae bacterium]|nr:uroporphyrinogen-III C-methyltransferase [Thermodesulfobacteriaceae bacterium]